MFWTYLSIRHDFGTVWARGARLDLVLEFTGLHGWLSSDIYHEPAGLTTKLCPGTVSHQCTRTSKQVPQGVINQSKVLIKGRHHSSLNYASGVSIAIIRSKRKSPSPRRPPVRGITLGQNTAWRSLCTDGIVLVLLAQVKPVT